MSAAIHDFPSASRSASPALSPSKSAEIKKAMSLSNIMDVDTPPAVLPAAESPVPQAAPVPVDKASTPPTDNASTPLVKASTPPSEDAPTPVVKDSSPSTGDTPSPDIKAQTPSTDAGVVADQEDHEMSDVKAQTPSINAGVAADQEDHEMSDTEAVDDTEPVNREFKCMNNEHSDCRTGQYTLKLSRKVISNHFGRNKACTRLITDWPLFCRKHYQRATYKPKLWQLRKVNLILRQFDVIERDFPGTTYTVSLKKSEMDRLNLFARKTEMGLKLEEAAAVVAPKSTVKSFQAPIDVLRELQYEIGENKTKDEVRTTVGLIHDMLNKGDTEEVPSIEFLPEIPRAQPIEVEVPKVVTPKKAAKGSGSRINSKGGIKKTSAK